VVSFGYPKHNQLFKKFAQQPFGTQSLPLIQRLDEKDWIKLMYI
jgi:hypothetical protein